MSKDVTTGKRLIALCGKGGTGKTAVSAMIARVLLDEAGTSKLLLIDADPALGLANAVGVKVRHTMGEIREKVIKTAEKGSAKEKNQLMDTLDYMVLDALQETDRFAFLAMGRTETLGCFCPVNDLLQDAIESLSRNFDTILIDGEAGVEQINRQVVSNLETLIIVSDATTRGLQTAALIKKMVLDENVIKCKKLGIVFNRVQGDEELLRHSAQELGLDVFGLIPLDANIVKYDLLGKPLLELPDSSPALVAVGQIVERSL